MLGYIIMFNLKFKCFMALKNTTLTPAKSAADIMNTILAYKSEHPEHLRNPFTQGLNFSDGEEVTFEGFSLQEWEDTEDARRYGAYLCVVLNGKPYSLSSPLKTKLGNLIDSKLNPKSEEGAWSASGGLAELLKGFADLSDENLQKIEDFFLEPKKGNKERKPIARKMWVRWIITSRGGQSSISNVL